jgi:hypothetical protein
MPAGHHDSANPAAQTGVRIFFSCVASFFGKNLFAGGHHI